MKKYLVVVLSIMLIAFSALDSMASKTTTPKAYQHDGDVVPPNPIGNCDNAKAKKNGQTLELVTGGIPTYPEIDETKKV